MKHTKVSIGFAVPSIILYSIFLSVPIIIALGLSLVDWNGIGTMTYVGLSNFKQIFKDRTFGMAVANTVILTVSQTLLCNVLGLAMALLVNRSDRLTAGFRALYFVPYVLGGVAIAFVWKIIFAYNGVLNMILQAIGLEHLVAAFTATRTGALICLIVVGTWSSLGYYMMIYLAALQSVPQDLYEAATVDGASGWNKFRYITLPLITSGTMISTLMSLINGLKAYDLVKIMTDGGPGNLTNTIVYSIARYGFSSNKMGYASALGVVLFVAISAFSLIVLRLFQQKED